MSEKPFVSEPLPIPELDGEHDFNRADLTFFGVDHSGASYQAHIFLNNPKATERTPRDSEHGYAGTFTIFGHGGCYGELGHCDLPPGPQEPTDLRLPHALTPQTKTVLVTEAVRRLREAGAREVTVTVIPVVRETKLPLGRGAEGPVLRFESVSLLTYESPPALA